MISILPYITKDIGLKYEVDMQDGMLKNHKPITLEEAKEINSKYIFSWKWRTQTYNGRAIVWTMWCGWH